MATQVTAQVQQCLDGIILRLHVRATTRTHVTRKANEIKKVFPQAWCYFGFDDYTRKAHGESIRIDLESHNGNQKSKP